MLAVALHGLHWLLGALVLRRTVRGCTLRPGRGPHWIAAWAIGLALHVVVLFTLEQLLGLTLSATVLLASGLGLLALVAAAGRRRRRPAAGEPAIEPPPGRPIDTGWTWPAAAVLAAAVFVFARLHGAMLLAPFQDWDSFLYHLPYGRLVADGAFPDDIAPDYAHVAAAYPPLFYLLYGLNFHLVDAVGAIDLTYVMPKATVTVVNALLGVVVWSLARDRLRLGREAAAWALLWLVLLLNWKANIQSVTALYFALAVYYAWPGERASTGQSGDPAPAPPRLSWLPGALLLAGCAWSNYTGLFLAAAFLAGAGWTLAWRGTRQTTIAWLATSAVVGALLAPFLLRNLLVAGNPVYPAALDLLGGVGATPWFLENDGVLRNAPAARASLPLAFHDARGAAPLLLAAAGALVVVGGRAQAATRAALATTLAAFVALWLVVLQPTWAMAWRHLQPVVPLAAVVAASQVDAARRPGSQAPTLGLVQWWVLVAMTAFAPQDDVPFAACLAVVLLLPAVVALAAPRIRIALPAWAPIAATTTAAIGLTVAVDLDTLSRVHAPGWIVPPWPDLLLPVAGVTAVFALAHLARRRRDAEGPSGIRGGALAGVLVLLAGLGVASLDAPRDPTGYRLDIRRDLEWMNRNLPEDAVVLTLEDRLFTLERDHVQASHYSLEPFYTASDPESGLVELERRGITHVYHTRSPIFRRQRFFWRKRLLFPAEDNPYAELLYRSPTGAVVAIRRPR